MGKQDRAGWKETGMRITKIYTRTGDASQTSLAGGQQDCPSVEAIARFECVHRADQSDECRLISFSELLNPLYGMLCHYGVQNEGPTDFPD